MKIIVTIPAYNEEDTIGIVISKINEVIKNNRYDCKILVVDDGSKDNTKATVKKLQKKHSNLFYFYKKNQGQGIARNFGLEKAKGGVVVFIGDDIIVIKDFLNEHLRYHLRFTRENEAVLGFITWHPKLVINSFMRWMTNGSAIFGRFGGHQFAYEKLAGKTEADFNFFYTSNISLKRSLIEKYPFDPVFSSYGWEDIELGYRLHLREDLRILYNPKAIGYHYHPMTEEDLACRMHDIGKSAKVFHHRYPELKKVPAWWKKFIFWLLSRAFFLHLFKISNRDLYYYALSKKYFLQGLCTGAQTGK